MILISKRMLLILAAVAVIVTLFLAAFGYRSMAGPGSNSSLLFTAQTFLYLGILLSIVEIFLFIRAAVRSRDIERELEKLIETTRYLGPSNARKLRHLGPIGGQIERLYGEINDLSERRALKIGALSELAEFLMNNLQLAAVAATIDGTIVYASRSFLERTKRTRSETIDTDLGALVPDVSLEEVLIDLDRTRAAVERKSGRAPLEFHPIRNIENSVAYVVCVFQGHASIVETKEPPERERAPSAGLRRLMSSGVSTVRKFTERRWFRGGGGGRV